MMLPIAHAADWITVLPVLGMLVWLIVVTVRQRREDAKKTEGDEPDDDAQA